MQPAKGTMPYILRMKKAPYVKTIGHEAPPPFLLFSEGTCGGTPKEEDATTFPSQRAAGEAFDAAGVGRREDYEILPVSGFRVSQAKREKFDPNKKLKFN